MENDDLIFEKATINKQDERKIGETPSSILVFDVNKGAILPQSSLTPIEAKNAAKRYGCIIPPVERSLPSILEKADPTHRSALDIKAIATSQKGYEIRGDSEKLKKFIKRPNYETFASFQDILDAFVYEFYVYDEAYLEIVRVADKISMFICPARYMYIKTNTMGRIVKYCYITNSGDITELEPYRGGELKNGVHYAVALKYYNTTSYYYGFPAYLFIEPCWKILLFVDSEYNSLEMTLLLEGIDCYRSMLSGENKTALNKYLSQNLGR